MPLIIGTATVRENDDLDNVELGKHPIGPSLCFKCRKIWGVPIRGYLLQLPGIIPDGVAEHTIIARALRRELDYFTSFLHPLEALALQADDHDGQTSEQVGPTS